VADAIRVGRPEASIEEVVEAARAARADEVIRSLPQGYETPIGEGGQRLSGGQRQRLALARAFLRDASLILLDEPTSHLDAASEAAIADAIRARAAGRTVLLIAHRPRLAAIADRIVTVDAGRVVEAGTSTQPTGPTPAHDAGLSVAGSA
jgi:ABC-type multidrug transport system fused ATPase/permease subunit